MLHKKATLASALPATHFFYFLAVRQQSTFLASFPTSVRVLNLQKVSSRVKSSAHDAAQYPTGLPECATSHLAAQINKCSASTSIGGESEQEEEKIITCEESKSRIGDYAHPTIVQTVNHDGRECCVRDAERLLLALFLSSALGSAESRRIRTTCTLVERPV